MKVVFGILFFVFIGSAFANATSICMIDKRDKDKKIFKPFDEMSALPLNQRLEYYKKYTDDLIAKHLEEVPCPKDKMGALETQNIHKAKLEAQAEPKNKDCYVALTGDPYCVSKANARRFCNMADNQALAVAKQCITNFKPMAPNKFILHSTCLGGGEVGLNPEEDKSNCIKESQRNPHKVDS